MVPVSYNPNNIFITDWDEGDFADLDFYDIFKRFYRETYAYDYNASKRTYRQDFFHGNESDPLLFIFPDLILQFHSFILYKLCIKAYDHAGDNGDYKGGIDCKYH